MLIQPIKHFPRLEIRLLQFLSETHLTHAEFNVVLEIISMSDFWNVGEGQDTISLYMQDRFGVSKRLMNRYLQKIRELDLIRPLIGNPDAFRGMPFLYNRQQFLNSLWEYDDVKSMAGWVLNAEFCEWKTNGDGSKTLGSPSYVRLTKRQNKSEKRISQSEHEKIVADLKLEHTRDINMLKVAFTQIIEETRQETKRELANMISEFKETLSSTLLELKKHDPETAERIEKKADYIKLVVS